MGNCDFKKDPPAQTIPTSNQSYISLLITYFIGISKANFQFHYIIGKGGYGKVNFLFFINE